MLNQILNILGMNFTIIKLIILSLLPVVELRGAIPIGLAYGYSDTVVYISALAGSLIPLPIVFFGIKPVFNLLKKYKITKGLVERLSIKAMRKSDLVKKYDWLGLLFFVAIPLPGTGVWSGALIANLLDVSTERAMISIIIGNMIAGAIVLVLSNGLLNLFF